MNLKEAIQDTKEKLQRRGWRVFRITNPQAYHLIAFEPNDKIHLVALTTKHHVRRKKQALRTGPSTTELPVVDIFCY